MVEMTSESCLVVQEATSQRHQSRRPREQAREEARRQGVCAPRPARAAALFSSSSTAA
jgi:hypothetical protein